MKTIKTVLLCSFIVIFSTTAEAQFLNRLKNRIVEKTEDVIINKAADKAAERTSEAMDKILNPPTVNALTAVSRPAPVPFTKTSTSFKPWFAAFFAACSAAL